MDSLWIRFRLRIIMRLYATTVTCLINAGNLNVLKRKQWSRNCLLVTLTIHKQNHVTVTILSPSVAGYTGTSLDLFSSTDLLANYSFYIFSGRELRTVAGPFNYPHSGWTNCSLRHPDINFDTLSLPGSEETIISNRADPAISPEYHHKITRSALA